MPRKVPTRTVLYYLFFGFVLTCTVGMLLRHDYLYIPTKDLNAIQALDDRKYDSITLALEPFRGIMLATNVLRNVDVFSVEDSYFPSIEYKPERITAQNPLLTTVGSCYQDDAIDFLKLTDSLILIFKAKSPEGSVYFFNKSPNCNGLKLRAIRGLSGVEGWGTWSDGEATEFAIETRENYPNGGQLILSVRPAINSTIKNDKRALLVEVDGKSQRQFNLGANELTTMYLDFDKKEPGDKISVVLNHLNPMRFSDMSGSDYRRVSIGFISAKLVSNGGKN